VLGCIQTTAEYDNEVDADLAAIEVVLDDMRGRPY
jgi:hypothetical protein